MASQSTIAGPVGTAPAGGLTKSPDLAPSTGGTRFVVDRYGPGRYLLKVVTALGGANAAPVTTSTYFAY